MRPFVILYFLFQIIVSLSMILSSHLVLASEYCENIFNLSNRLNDEQRYDRVFSGYSLNPKLRQVIFSDSFNLVDHSILSAFSSIEIAKALVYRLYLKTHFKEKYQDGEFTNEEHSVNLSDFVELQHKMAITNFKKIKENGFENYFQQNPEIDLFSKDKSTSYAKKRHLTEERIIGAQFSSVKSDQNRLNKLRPTYAFVASPGLKIDYQVKTIVPSNRIVIIFNDNLQFRTTAVMDDSYDRYPNLGQGRPIFQGPPIGRKSSMTEAQIWGEVLYHDIKELIISPDISYDDLSYVKSTGLPIYEGASVLGPYGFQFIKTRRIQ